MSAVDKIIIALDFSSKEQAMKTVDGLGEMCRWYKVGSELFTACGPEIIRELQNRNKNIFLDLKYHDIPNTVGSAAGVCTQMGVRMFNVHASGGSVMMKKAREISEKAAQESGKKRPLLLAVTILTSLTSEMLVDELKTLSSVKNQVIHLAKLARDNGADGVVCSPFEIEGIKDTCGDDFVVVTPGVRPQWSVTDDQKRFKTPRAAVNAGADFLVIGRPVTKSPDPLAALEKIFQEIKS